MIDYYGFVQGFAILFIVAPLVVGAGAGAIWGWRTGLRGSRLILPTLVGGVAFTLIIFVVAVLFSRA